MKVMDEAEDKEMLKQALSAGDDWLRKQGVISDFSINAILVSTYVNFPQVRNVELDIDRTNQRLYMRVYCSIWSILLMMILRRRQKFVDALFDWLQEYLPTYQLSVELKRWRGEGGGNGEAVINSRNERGVDVDTDEDGPSDVQRAFEQARTSGGSINSNDVSKATAKNEQGSEPKNGSSNSQGNSEGQS
jgi:hypothetical protein